MVTKKYLLGMSVIATMLLGVSGVALAKLVITPVTNEISVNAQVEKNSDKAQQMILQVGPHGEVLLRGTVSVVGTTSLTVKSWGGDWVVNISSASKLMPETTMAQFKVGDFVGIQGAVNQTASWTVDAKLVRNWTAKKVIQENKQTIKTERHNSAQEIKEVMKNEKPKNWQGTVSNINVDAKSFTLTVDGSVYTVNLVADAKIVDKAFLSTDLAKVKEGDTVRVWGPVTDTTISAYVFRDISLMTK